MSLKYKKELEKLIHLHPVVAVSLLFATFVLAAINHDIYLPAVINMQKHFNTSEFMIQFSMIVFFLGAIVSRTLWGAVSDIYGRKIAFIGTLGIQIIMVPACIYAPSVEYLILFRLIQSLGSGFINVVSVAVVADLFQEKDRPSIYALLDISYPIGFVLGPILGAFIADYYDWQGCFWFVFFSLIVIAILVGILLPETNYDKSKKTVRVIYKEYFKFFRNKELFVCGAITGLIIGGYLSFAIHSPFIYMIDNKLSSYEYAGFQAAPMVISFFAIILYRELSYNLHLSTCIKIGIAGFLLLSIACFSVQFLPRPINPYVNLTLISFYNVLTPFLVPSLTAKALELYPGRSGMSSSVLSSLRSLFMCLCMLITGYFVKSEAGAIFFSIGITILVVFLLWIVLYRSRDDEDD